jgi:nitrate reductase delta subunit
MLREAIPDIRDILNSEKLPGSSRTRLNELLMHLAHDDLIECQETYVETFDRGRAHALHLFEHVHGESRDRGQAMVDLRERYLAAGLEPSTNELPDYLPLFLEYCSMLPHDEALAQLAEPGVILVALAARLEKHGSPYASVLSALCAMAGIERTEAAENAVVPADDPDPEDFAALDKAWEDQQVTFNSTLPQAADSQSCPQADAMVARFLKADGAPQPHERSNAHG